MSATTGIEWTDATWNAITGCEQVSPGCARCYAKVEHDRRHKASLAGKSVAPQYAQPFEVVQLHADRLDAPLRKRAPTKYFVTSGADPFHDAVPFEYVAAMFGVMAAAQRHTFQLLTKRPARMLEFFEWFPSHYNGPLRTDVPWYSEALLIVMKRQPDSEWVPWPLPNVWLGVSVENQRWADERIPLLLQTPAAIRFLSCEPLLGPVDLTRVCVVPRKQGSVRAGIHINALTGHYAESGMPYIGDWDISGPYPEGAAQRSIDWVIVGGESGTGARPMHPEWEQSLREQCIAAGVPYFFKQWGDWQECDPTEEKEYDDAAHASHGCRFLNNTDGTDRDCFTGGAYMRRVGKKRAGRKIDGRTWDEFPEAAHA